MTERERSYMNERSTYNFFSLFLFFLSVFFLFFSRRSLPFSFLFFVASLFLFFFSFLLLSIPAFFFDLFVDVGLWCSKTIIYGNQVCFESLKNSAGTSTKLIYVIFSYTYIYWIHTDAMITDAVINDAVTIKMQEGRRKKTSLEKYSPLTLLQGFERVVEGLHVRGCWRPNINFIFWPHCYDHHVVAFLFSEMLNQRSWGPLHRGFSEGPHGRVWPSLPHLVSTIWKSAGNCLGGFPSAPSVGCGLPYHIWSLLSGSLLATASGVFRVPPRSGVAFPTTSGLYRLEVCWQLPWDPNSTELNNNSTPTRSPTGSLKSNV